MSNNSTTYKTASLLLLLFFSSWLSFSYSFPANIQDENAGRPLAEVLDDLGERYKVFVSYQSKLINGVEVDFTFKQTESLEMALDRLLTEIDFSYELYQDQYLIIYKNSKKGSRNAKRIQKKIAQIKQLEKKGNLTLLRNNKDLSRRNQEVLTELKRRRDQSISGKVTAENGTPLIGATVRAKESSQGTLTNQEGEYTLILSDEVKNLTFSYVGYEKQEVEIAGRKEIDIVLLEEIKSLEDVVITALGMKREKKSLGYAVQDVQGEVIQKSRELDVVNSLSGKIAGVNITQGGGGLGGGGARVVIRGETSLSGKNTPLFVIDGIPASSNDVASDDIASISVLKGPAAAALYGSRAAAGVILITTKSGASAQSSRVGVDVNLSVSSQRPFILPSYQNEFGQGSGSQYRYFDGNNGTWPDGSISNDDSRINWGPRFDGQLRPQFTGNNPWQAYPDNVKEFYERGIIANNNIAVYGASQEGDFRLSYTNIIQKGIIPNTGLQTDRLDFSGGWKLSDKWDVRANIKYIDSRSDNNQGYDVRLYPRNIDIHALKSYWVPGMEGLQQLKWRSSANNPYFILRENRRAFNNQRLIGYVMTNYQISEEFSVMGRIGQNRNFNENSAQNAFSTVGNNNKFGAFSTGQSRSRELNADFLLKYQRNFGEDLNIIISAGGNHLRQDGSNISSSVEQLLVPNIYNLGNRRVFPKTGNNVYEKELNSLYAFTNIGYKDYLYLDITARNDWSSTLPTNNNSYFYPSATLSAVLNEAISLPKPISFWKLRIGLARVGNDTDPYALQDQFFWGTGENGVASIIQSNVKANPELKPEITSAWEVGTDIRFFNNRWKMDLTYYNSITSNQILRVEVSPTTGYDFILKNAGKIRSSGWELILNGQIFQSKNFSWRTTLNWSRDRSIVEEYDPENPDAFLSRSITTHLFVEDKLGERRGAMYGKGYERAPNGEILYTKSGDTQRSDKIFLGNYNPDWMGSLYNELDWGPLSLAFLLDVRYGGAFYSSTNYNLNIRGLSEATLLGGTDANGNFTPRENILPEGMYLDEGTYRKLTKEDLRESGLSSGGLTGQQYWENIMDSEIPEAVIYDASYIKFRELSFSIALPNSFISKLSLQSARAGIVVRNLAVWTDVPNVDAETFSFSNQAGAVPGLDRGGIPSVRNIALNLNLKF
ncbi:MAG: SusC/RagA family TonB-linked outer membrane protein [Bacteroidia bacterium]|nr:SusC/RagA family TonB-linked outer membrane protein [Bacteroidia bacterium]